jgi:hypothetical protein
MTEPDIFDQEIHALQQRLRAAWQQLGDPTLTAFTRRELRNQMKQCSADLRSYLQKASERRSQPIHHPVRTFSKPELRILA